MLDRSESYQFHYYQPGIGTYVTSHSLSTNGTFARMKSAYLKAKDSAIGSSFAEHVMGGYKFLMRYYAPGDDIYFIGFSRGSYIARFLAQMLDYIGLLEAGNEELIRFAWKTFAKWQRRQNETEEDRKERDKLFAFMKAFRETFSRPVSRIRFMGLFDTVNSVPTFESAWMERSKFPYTARSSARVIRHAVGIDERRAKFRQDLISEAKPVQKPRHHLLHHHHHHHLHDLIDQGKDDENAEKTADNPAIVVNDGENAATDQATEEGEGVYRASADSRPTLRNEQRMRREQRYRAPSRSQRQRNMSLAVPGADGSHDDSTSIRSNSSFQVPTAITAEDDESEQDIEEVWFPGGHADIGGGWQLSDGEHWPLSHAPLVWMVQEAQRAGLQLDPSKVKRFECSEAFEGDYSPISEDLQDPGRASPQRPEVREDGDNAGTDAEDKQKAASVDNFRNALVLSSTKGIFHDCLAFGNGLSSPSVLTWKIMEYLPFRRMDLQGDGSWKPIRWPLPRGEVRDIPEDAQIHVSALRRLQGDPNYRPGNLIIGGGGRGVRRAPESLGTGEWVVSRYEGDIVRETYIRKSACKDEH